MTGYDTEMSVFAHLSHARRGQDGICVMEELRMLNHGGQP